MPLDPGLDPLFDAAGKQYDIDPALLRSVALAESSGDPRVADSPQGAKGLMQFLPATAAAMGVADPYDPAQAIPGAARYLAQGLAAGERMKAQGGDVDPAQYALMYYHGGPDTAGWGPKTHAYVDAVARRYNFAVAPGPEAPGNPVVLAHVPADFAPPPDVVAASRAAANAAPPAGGAADWPFDLPVRMSLPALRTEEGGSAPPGPAADLPLAKAGARPGAAAARGGGAPSVPLPSAPFGPLPTVPTTGELPSPDDPAMIMGQALPPDLVRLALAGPPPRADDPAGLPPAGNGGLLPTKLSVDDLAGLRPEDVLATVGRSDLTPADRAALDRRLTQMQQGGEGAPPSAAPALPPDLARLAAAGNPALMAPLSDAGPGALGAPSSLRDAGPAGGLAPGGGAELRAPPQAPLAPSADLDALRNLALPGNAPAGPAGGPPAAPPPSAAESRPGPSPAPAPAPAPAFAESLPLAKAGGRPFARGERGAQASEDFSGMSLDELAKAYDEGRVVLGPPPDAPAAARPSGSPAPTQMAQTGPASAPMAIAVDPAAQQFITDLRRRAFDAAKYGLGDIAKSLDEQADSLTKSGLVMLPGGRLAAVPEGPHDLDFQKRSAAATAGGQESGKAPFDLVETTISTPQGDRKVWVPKSELLANPPPAAPSPRAGGAAGAGPGTPAIGVQVGTPVKPLGYDEAAPLMVKVNDAATAAQSDLGTIQAIRSILKGAPGDPALQTGWLAGARADIANKLGTLGIDASGLNNASSAQELHKLTLQLAAKAAGAAGKGQESVLKSFVDAYPSIETRSDAIDLMTNMFAMNAQRDLDRQRALLAAWTNGGDLFGNHLQAAADFARTNPAQNYFRAAEIQSQDAARRTWAQVNDPQQIAAIKQLVPVGSYWYDERGQRRLRGGAPAPAPTPPGPALRKEEGAPGAPGGGG